MAKTIIHVNRQFIAFNAKHGPVLPVYIVRSRGKKTMYAYGVGILGESRFIDPRDQKQLSCGARAWLETDSDYTMSDPMTFADAQALKTRFEVKRLTEERKIGR